MTNDSLWKQRFYDFGEALQLLRLSVKDKIPEQLLREEQLDIMRQFEITFSLAWKLMKTFIEANGVSLEKFDLRSIIKVACAIFSIRDKTVWNQMVKYRNTLSHRYDAATFQKVLSAIFSSYIPALTQVEDLFTKIINERESPQP